MKALRADVQEEFEPAPSDPPRAGKPRRPYQPANTERLYLATQCEIDELVRLYEEHARLEKAVLAALRAAADAHADVRAQWVLVDDFVTKRDELRRTEKEISVREREHDRLAHVGYVPVRDLELPRPRDFVAARLLEKELTRPVRRRQPVDKKHLELVHEVFEKRFGFAVEAAWISEYARALRATKNRSLNAKVCLATFYAKARHDVPQHELVLVLARRVLWRCWDRLARWNGLIALPDWMDEELTALIVAHYGLGGGGGKGLLSHDAIVHLLAHPDELADWLENMAESATPTGARWFAEKIARLRRELGH